VRTKRIARTRAGRISGAGDARDAKRLIEVESSHSLPRVSASGVQKYVQSKSFKRYAMPPSPTTVEATVMRGVDNPPPLARPVSTS